MHFLLADTFTSSLARLTGDEQKLVKTTAFDLHRLDKAKESRIESVTDEADLE